MLKLKNLKTFYGNIQVLKGVSIQISEGEIITLIGANGAGKTTTLMSICGIVPPDSGEIIFMGKPIHNIKPNRIVSLGISQVPEGRQIFPFLTVRENLEMGAFLRADKNSIKQDIEYVFELFPKLKWMGKRFASTLSGGEARMLAIARGLMSNAKFLAVDEPSLGLAPILRVEVFNKIQEIHAKGMSILLVEQNIPQLADIAEKIYLMEEGRIVFSGDKEEARNNQDFREAFLGM